MFEGDFYSRIWWCWGKNSSNYQRNSDLLEEQLSKRGWGGETESQWWSSSADPWMWKNSKNWQSEHQRVIHEGVAVGEERICRTWRFSEAGSSLLMLYMLKLYALCYSHWVGGQVFVHCQLSIKQSLEFERVHLTKCSARKNEGNLQGLLSGFLIGGRCGWWWCWQWLSINVLKVPHTITATSRYSVQHYALI